MLFLKYFFLFLIFLGISFISNLFSKKYKNRIKDLKSIKEAYSILESKMNFTYEPLGEIFMDIYNTLKKQTNLCDIFKETSVKMKKYNFKTAWENSIEENKQRFNLLEEDIYIIKGLGNMLGKTDIQGQLSEINLGMNFIDTQIKKAEEDQEKNEKMYKSLGTILALAIVIILI